MLLIAGAAISAALVFRWLHKRTFNPATIFLGVLGLQLMIYALLVDKRYDPPSYTTVLTAGCGLLGFFVGYAIALVCVWPACSRSLGKQLVFYEIRPPRAARILRIAIYASVLAMVWHTAVGLDNLSQGATGIAPLDLRTVYLSNPRSFGLAPHAAIFAQFLFVFLYLHGHRPRATMTLFIALTVFCAVWKMERSAVMMALVTALIAYEIKSGHLPVSRLAATFCLAIAAFVSTAFLRDSWDSLGDVLLLMVDYFARNLENFSNFVSHQHPSGELSLLLGKYGTVLGVPEKELILDQEDFFNTYSYLKNVYLFGGVWFCGAFASFVGGAFAVLYAVGLPRRPLLATLYCFFAFTLFLAFFEYTFSWTNWAYYAISALVTKLLLLKDREQRVQPSAVGAAEVQIASTTHSSNSSNRPTGTTSTPGASA
jgi:oligosaccharide repeat unit polymerase